MNIPLFERLYKEGLLSAPSLQNVKQKAGSKLFSVHWELKTILYLGILLLTGGLGILIYKNIDTIGHQVILAAIGLLCAGCFFYCERKKLPFATTKVPAPNSFFDYILLLGCLTLVTFITYLQVQYIAFGRAYGLATFIPMVILFFCAYYFDHLGVLSMAITNLAAWAGVAITPLNIVNANNFADAKIIFAGLVLGVALAAIAWASQRRNIKAHFEFTYVNFGMNILFISSLAGMFQFDNFYPLWLLPLAAAVFYFYKRAIATGFFYYILMLALYGYIGISYVIVRFLIVSMRDLGIIYLILLYFIGSATAIIVFLSRMNKKMKLHDRI
ncbi:DUF2157 domain-containing protein [Niastella yeongjuensis]|uniref:DUF2157 domain-containing protein n=1 Tax=Niastella yeongjuensis TaxID=354355 RepID=A0A1V9F0G5_9BACT|nr:DUF2157 domain-containing protein [Niastella yeongjuensis]OQP51795.1 DUF2157 domain-containing protein [Niastella yeongjuensis]SEP44705.1 Predicted membrane protein [Niastella yeongjuensis]